MLDLPYGQKRFESTLGDDAFGEELARVAGAGFANRLVVHSLDNSPVIL